MEGLYEFIYGYTEHLDDLPDGAFWAMHEAAVCAFNEEFSANYDWFDIMQEYIQWSNKKGLHEK